MSLKDLLVVMFTMFVAAAIFFTLPMVGLILAGMLIVATPVLLFLGQVRPSSGVVVPNSRRRAGVHRGVLVVGEDDYIRDVTPSMRRAS